MVNKALVAKRFKKFSRRIEIWSPEPVYNAGDKKHGQRFRVWYKVKNALDRNAKTYQNSRYRVVEVGVHRCSGNMKYARTIEFD